MYAALYPKKVKNLVTLVAPFDFSTDDGLLFSWAKHMNIDALVDAYRVVPGDFMNSGFLRLMPFTSNPQVRGHARRDRGREKLLNFLRMEKWIFDSPARRASACGSSSRTATRTTSSSRGR